MSYILEALKKAEAERELSQVPGLSTAQGNSTIYITHQSNARAWWIAGGLAVLLVAVVGAWALRSTGGATEGTQMAVNPQPTAPVVVTAPAPAPTPAPVPAAVPSAAPETAPTVAPAPLKPPSAKELPRTAVAPVVVGKPPSTKPEPLKVPSVAPSPAPVVAPAPARSAPASPGVSAQAATSVPAVAVPEPAKPAAPVTARASGAVPAFAELPDALRKQIPALHISGAVYSDSPPEWALIINDQVLTRGSQVTPDVRLEEVTGSSAVFNFKGQRFRMDR